MNPSYNGGLDFPPEDRARQTAAEIARKKVLAAYSAAPDFKPADAPNSSYKNTPIDVDQAAQNPDLQKYHTAWQNYYQKYYSDYYAKAARTYVETERLKQNIQDKATKTPKKAFSTKHRALLPLAAGAFVVLFILFLQYNRLVFAPLAAYIAPGDDSGSSITALDATLTTAPTKESKLIIPKLNVNVPVAFGIPNDDASINAAMNSGVAHFAVPGADALPGQVGNTVITGHSAGDIYSNNQYKFVFSGLERLEVGDLIYVNYGGVRYTYSMVGSTVVEPTDVQSLVYDTDKPMLTLITCTPLGTARYRLLITAEQINPAPATATTPAPSTPAETEPVAEAEALPANEKSFFEKLFTWSW